MSAQLIKNGRLVMETRVIDGGAVLIEDGKIARIYDKTPDLSGERLNVIDAGGLYVSPGFIDVHVHGGGGYDFLCGDEDNVLSACRTHLKHGTTAIMATIMTMVGIISVQDAVGVAVVPPAVVAASSRL